MTRIILVDSKDELIIHNFEIYNKESVKRVNSFISSEERTRGHPLERILIREGFVTVMEIRDGIPIPTEFAGFNR